jgi:hypothetical protein
MNHDDVRRVVREELSRQGGVMHRRRMVVVGAPAGGRVNLAETTGGATVASARYFAGTTLVSGDTVEVYLVEGQHVVIGKLA